jgi:acyl-CoA synthetase (AMP-forming)/AMP-acid ligase II/acyl carrier protein
MKMLDANRITGIRQVNSVEFVKAAFGVYNSGDVLIILKQTEPGFGIRQERTPAPGGGWLDIRQDVVHENRPAQIVFTSGTEGASKAILLSHRALADVVVRLNRVMQLNETVREYVGVPVTYSFGFGRCRAVAAAGGRCFIPENGFNPAELARMLAADEINAVSAVPTLWRTLLTQPEILGGHGRKVKWIEIGSQYMSRAEKEKMKGLFPNAIIVQHYGLTEASRTTLLDISETEGELLESVGKACGEVQVKISPDGLIMIRGPHVASGRIVNGEITPIVDAEGWYTTGDYGRMEGEYLYYGGRADDLINCGGIKVNPDALQERVGQRLHAGNAIAVCRIDDALRGDGFFVAVDASAVFDHRQIEDVTHAELQTLGVNARSSIRIQEVEAIPRTETGKVRRKDLAKLYRPVELQPSDPSASAQQSGTVRDLYASIFRIANISPRDTFRSLGGDSLNYVQMLMLLEKRFGSAPTGWDNLSIEQLESMESKKTSALISWLDTSIFLRVAAILGVVATHSGGSVLGGGTLLLFALIGYNMARFKSVDLFHGKVWPWLRSYALVILIPYYLIAALDQGWARRFEADVWLLYANLMSAKISLTFPFWFVQVLLQCLLVIGVVFSVPRLRRHAASSPATFSFSLLAFLIAVRVIYPYFWDTRYLNHLVPLRFMAILWLGWCFYIAENPRQKLWMFVTGVGFALLDTKLAVTTGWLVIGSLFLAFVPRVPVPAFTSRLFNDIGAATFYIFIFNGLIILLQRHIVAIDSVVIVFCISLLGSIAFWWLIERSGLAQRAWTLLRVKN